MWGRRLFGKAGTFIVVYVLLIMANVQYVYCDEIRAVNPSEVNITLLDNILKCDIDSIEDIPTTKWDVLLVQGDAGQYNTWYSESLVSDVIELPLKVLKDVHVVIKVYIDRYNYDVYDMEFVYSGVADETATSKDNGYVITRAILSNIRDFQGEIQQTELIPEINGVVYTYSEDKEYTVSEYDPDTEIATMLAGTVDGTMQINVDSGKIYTYTFQKEGIHRHYFTKSMKDMDANDLMSDYWATRRSNCYAYALEFHRDYWLIPGKLSLQVISNTISEESDYVKRMQDDMDIIGGFVCDYSDEVPLGMHKIASVYSLNPDGSIGDFHFYRLTADGSWVHKMGSGRPSDVDARGEVIYDPRVAGRDYGADGIRYNVFDNFYMVPDVIDKEIYPWFNDKLYTPYSDDE